MLPLLSTGPGSGSLSSLHMETCARTSYPHTHPSNCIVCDYAPHSSLIFLQEAELWGSPPLSIIVSGSEINSSLPQW